VLLAGIVLAKHMLINQWILITLPLMTVFARVTPLVANARLDIIALKVVIYQNPVLVDITVLEHEIPMRQISVALDIIAQKEHGNPSLTMV
jgi:hypothetical protein